MIAASLYPKFDICHCCGSYYEYVVPDQVEIEREVVGQAFDRVPSVTEFLITYSTAKGNRRHCTDRMVG